MYNRAIVCTLAMFEFYIYARYQSHDDSILSYMRDTLCRFHIIIDVFFLGRASKNVKAKANAPITELVKKRKVDKGTNAAT